MDLPGLVARLDEQLGEADAALRTLYPGARPGRQPVHTLYVPADQYGAGLAARALTGVVPRQRGIGVGQELVELGRQRVRIHGPGL